MRTCRFHFPPLAAMPLLLAAALPGPAPASEAPAHGRTPATESAKGAAVDPMAHLKARLQEKLGAARSEEKAAGSNELRVPSHTPTAAPTRVARADSNARELATLVEAHRAGRDLAVSSHDVHWSYTGEGGPAKWSQLKPEFSTCATGQRQSPIDIRDGISVDLEAPAFDYRAGGFSVVDNGHTVQVNVAPGNSMTVMGRRYELVQFHFHRPSEERINGRQYEMSVHLVHKDPDGRLAVVGVLLERGAAQPVVQEVWNNLPLERLEPLAAQDSIDPVALLPTDRRYYAYMGSLTTPPCSEGVLWMVMQQPVQASPEQIHIFSRLYPMNARPVQQASGRLIKQSQ
jgi:carbonic anhydrase